jgi:predicted DNA-binding protein
MAKADAVEHLNALIPADLKRRMKIASANTGKRMTALLIEWIEAGLATVEGEHKPAGKGRK